MLTEILLISNVMLFLALALEAKIRSKIGFVIVVSGLMIGVVDIIFVLLSLLK